MRSGGTEGGMSRLALFLGNLVSGSDHHDSGNGNNGNDYNNVSNYSNGGDNNVSDVNNVHSKSCSERCFPVLSKITDLSGYLDCESHFRDRRTDNPHFCGADEARVYYDPLEQAWCAWYPCCGRGCKVPESFYRV